MRDPLYRNMKSCMSEWSVDSIFFSIVIPAYNRADRIGKTLESVLEQTFFQFEVLVVNDGSTDDTVGAVKPYLADHRVRLFSIENGERGAARNFGVRQARGAYVTFLDSDDLLLPWHLSEAFSIAKNHTIDIFHLNYEILHGNGRIETLQVLPREVNEKLLEGNFLSCLGIFGKRELWLRYPFDESRVLAGSEDYELWLRIAARIPIYCFPQVTSRLVNHTARSVVKVDRQGLVSRITALEQKLKADQKFTKAFEQGLGRLHAYTDLYLALHLALSGGRWAAVQLLPRIVSSFPRIVFSYRFMVLIKKILIR